MGPLTHYAVMCQVKKVLMSEMGVTINTGSLMDVIEPDLKKQHDDWTGQINGWLFEEICSGLKSGKDISRAVRWVAHFILDYHAFTQSFPGYTTSDDGKMDVFAETVISKDKYLPVLKEYSSKEEIMVAVQNSINEMNARYSKGFKKGWLKFVLFGSFKEFIRVSVQRASGFTFSLVALAKNS